MNSWIITVNLISKLSYETKYVHIIGIVISNIYCTFICILRLHHMSDLLRMLTMRAKNLISLLLTFQ